MLFRVLQSKTFVCKNGDNLPLKEGQLVDLDNLHLIQQLMDAKIITPKDNHSFQFSLTPKREADVRRRPPGVKRRVGAFIFTGPHYSGGRVHLYQYLLNECLLSPSTEVLLFTNAKPAWQRDYPQPTNLHVLVGHGTTPDDLDVVVSDGKGEEGERALQYALTHPAAHYVVFNFESKNWVERYCPEYAAQFDDVNMQRRFEPADLVVCNSGECERYYREWTEWSKNQNTLVMYPAVNDIALNDTKFTVKEPRPYAVYSARASLNKSSDVLQKVASSLSDPLDFVLFGQPSHPLASVPGHDFKVLTGRSDAEKFAYYKSAAVVLAPSMFEGCGMVPLEALASGTRCVCYDLPVIRETCGGDVTYADLGDEAAFCEHVKRTLKKKRFGVRKSLEYINAYGLEAQRESVSRLVELTSVRKTLRAQA